MGDYRQTGKPSGFITNIKVSSVICPSRVGKSSTGLSVWVKVGCVHLFWVAVNIPYGR